MPHCLSIPTPTPSPPDVNGFNLFADKTNSLPISDQQKKNFAIMLHLIIASSPRKCTKAMMS
jgi:hypothetical protein